MTTGPRNTPHPIILHVDDQGNPVRLAEASSIYVTAVSAVSISATNYLGLNINSPGVPVGESTEIQFRKSATEFDGDTSLTYDKQNQRLNAVEIVVGDLSSTTNIFSEEIITAVKGFSGASVTATNAFINTISATMVSAVTVCATNYNSLFDSLSFTNLDSRYLNSSGDSVTGSFYIQNVSSVSLSATNYLNLPSSLATWNASAIRGIPVTSTLPGIGETLIYKDGVWQPSAITGGGGGGTPGGTAPGAIQFKNGAFFSGLDTAIYNQSISGIQSIGLSSTNLSSVNIRVTTISATTYNNIGESTAKWNANQIQGFPVSKPGSVAYKDIIAGRSIGGAFEKADIATYGGWVYDQIKSTIHSELPQTNASSIRNIQVTSTIPVANDVLAYSGSVWIPSQNIKLQSVSATNLSAINYFGLPALDASSLRGYNVSSKEPSAGQVLVYSSSVNAWTPGYRIYQSSSAPNNLLGLEGDIYLQFNSNTLANASGILSATVLSKELGNGSGLGSLIYDYGTNTYQPISFKSRTLNGTRDAFDIPYQGNIVASYLGSASEYFQIDPYWNTDELPALPTPYPYPNLPKNNDVLIFTDDLYNKSLIAQPLQTKAWTWKALSFSGGFIQDVDTDGAVVNNILSYNGTTWGYSPSASLTTVSTTSLTAASATITTVSATNYRNLPYTKASAIDIYPIVISTTPITNNSILSYTNNAWRPSFSSLVATVSATNLSSTNSVINNLKTSKIYTTKTNVPIVTSSVDLNLSSQNFELILSSNIVNFSIVNYNNDSIKEEFLLFIKYNSNTTRTITWTQGDPSYYINWPSAIPPTLTCSNGKLDIFRFVTLDGLNWYGSVVGQNYTVN